MCNARQLTEWRAACLSSLASPRAPRLACSSSVALSVVSVAHGVEAGLLDGLRLFRGQQVRVLQPAQLLVRVGLELCGVAPQLLAPLSIALALSNPARQH